MKFKYFILPAFLFFAGCTNNPTLNNDKNICMNEPKWVLNIPKDGVYGVGIAPLNFYGEQAQRQSAIAKAVNEIASQMNTTVDSKTIITTSVHNGKGDSTFNNISFQNVNGQKVKAIIVKSCKNPDNGKLYILMKATP